MSFSLLSLKRPNESLKSEDFLTKLRSQAVVIEDIKTGHLGRIKHKTTYWFSLAIDPTQTFQAGDLVEVLYREGNTLFVQAFPKEI